MAPNSKQSRVPGHYSYILAMLWVRANPRALFTSAMGVLDSEKWPRICSNSIFNIGHHLGQVHRVKGARNELEMAPAVPKRDIVHVVRIWAQSEQLCESFTNNAIGFWKFRIVGTRSPRPEIAFLGSPQVWCTPENYRNSCCILMGVVIPLGPQCKRASKFEVSEITQE